MTNHKKREKTEAVMVTEKNLTQYALTVKRFVEILLRTVQNPQKDVKVVTVEDVTVPMIDMVVGQKRGASTVIKLDISLEIVNQPDVMDAIEIDVEEVDPEVMIVEEEEILGQGVEIEGGGDLQLEATQEKETTEEEGQMTEELEEDLQVREALAQKVSIIHFFQFYAFFQFYRLFLIKLGSPRRENNKKDRARSESNSSSHSNNDRRRDNTKGKDRKSSRSRSRSGSAERSVKGSSHSA